MWLESVDRLLAIILIVLGCGQCIATPYFFPQIAEPAAWFFAGGMLLALVGALSLLRLRYRGVAPGVEWVSVGANLLLSAFWVALAWGLFYKFVRYPAAFTGLVVTLASTACSVSSWGRRGIKPSGRAGHCSRKV